MEFQPRTRHQRTLPQPGGGRPPPPPRGADGGSCPAEEGNPTTACSVPSPGGVPASPRPALPMLEHSASTSVAMTTRLPGPRPRHRASAPPGPAGGGLTPSRPQKVTNTGRASAHLMAALSPVRRTRGPGIGFGSPRPPRRPSQATRGNMEGGTNTCSHTPGPGSHPRAGAHPPQIAGPLKGASDCRSPGRPGEPAGGAFGERHPQEPDSELNVTSGSEAAFARPGVAPQARTRAQQRRPLTLSIRSCSTPNLPP